MTKRRLTFSTSMLIERSMYFSLPENLLKRAKIVPTISPMGRSVLKAPIKVTDSRMERKAEKSLLAFFRRFLTFFDIRR